MASTSEDKTVKLWDIRKTNSELVKELKLPTQNITTCIQFHPYNTTLAYGSTDKIIRAWDIDTYTPVYATPFDKQPIIRFQYDTLRKGIYVGTDSGVRYYKTNDSINYDLDSVRANIGRNNKKDTYIEKLSVLEAYEMGWNKLQDMMLINNEALYALTSYGKSISYWALPLVEQNNFNIYNYYSKEQLGDKLKDYISRNINNINNLFSNYKEEKSTNNKFKYENSFNIFNNNTNFDFSKLNINDVTDIIGNLKSNDDKNELDISKLLDIINNDIIHNKNKLGNIDEHEKLLEDAALSFLNNTEFNEIKHDMSLLNNTQQSFAFLDWNNSNQDKSMFTANNLNNTLNLETSTLITNNNISNNAINKRVINNDELNISRDSLNTDISSINGSFYSNFIKDEKDSMYIDINKNKNRYNKRNTTTTIINYRTNNLPLINNIKYEQTNNIKDINKDNSCTNKSLSNSTLPSIQRNNKSSNKKVNDDTIINNSNIDLISLNQLNNNLSNTETNDDLLLIDSLCNNKENINKIYKNRVFFIKKLNDALFINYGNNHNLESLFNMLKNCRESTVIKNILLSLFERHDIDKVCFNFNSINILLNVSYKIYKSNHMSYHEASLLCFHKIINYIFNKLTLAKSKLNNCINKEDFFGNISNNEEITEDMIYISNFNNTQKATREDKINYILKIFKIIYTSSKLKQYCENDFVNKIDKLENIKEEDFNCNDNMNLMIKVNNYACKVYTDLEFLFKTIKQ